MTILIIGGLGYIGSLTVKELAQQHYVHVVDAYWHPSSSVNREDIRRLCGGNFTYEPTQFQNLSKSVIQQFDAVILFAGHSSVAMSRGVITDALYNNVAGPIDLVNKLRPDQLFIYSSSSSVYGDASNTIATETHPHAPAYTEYDFTKRTFDDYMQMQSTHARWWGLRYATVCGGAPVLRTDLMINMMYHTAHTQHKIYVFGGEVRRSLLHTKQLVSGITSILNNPHSAGIYNLSSLGSTNIQIADAVAQKLNVAVEHRAPEGISKTTSSRYNYIIDSTKFETTFNCSLIASISDIIDSLHEYYPSAQLTTREMPYECHAIA
jgi:nucleoside-diphosphate-sugar epimerase